MRPPIVFLSAPMWPRTRSGSSASGFAEPEPADDLVLPLDVLCRAAELADAEKPRGAHAHRHRLAVQQRVAESRGGLERMADGVTVVEDARTPVSRSSNADDLAP